MARSALGRLAANSLEALEWDDGRHGLQVLTCEQCGFQGCNGGDWVRIVRLGASLLWVPTWISQDAQDDWEADEYRPPVYLRQHGAVLIRQELWDMWRSSYAALPDVSVFPLAGRRDIAAAWLLETPTRVGTFSGLRDQLLPEILAGVRIGRDETIRAVAAVADWLDQPAGEEPLTGCELRRLDEATTIETVYLDGLADWHPIAHEDARLGPAFRGGVVLDPAPLPW